MATQASPGPPVTEFAGQFFFRLWRATHTRTAEVLGSLGLTPALFAVLNVIGAREGAIQQELGAALGIDRSTMVSLIASGGQGRFRPHANAGYEYWSSGVSVVSDATGSSVTATTS